MDLCSLLAANSKRSCCRGATLGKSFMIFLSLNGVYSIGQDTFIGYLIPFTGNMALGKSLLFFMVCSQYSPIVFKLGWGKAITPLYRCPCKITSELPYLFINEVYKLK
jgi:hypothetical protein